MKFRLELDCIIRVESCHVDQLLNLHDYYNKLFNNIYCPAFPTAKHQKRKTQATNLISCKARKINKHKHNHLKFNGIYVSAVKT